MLIICNQAAVASGGSLYGHNPHALSISNWVFLLHIFKILFLGGGMWENPISLVRISWILENRSCGILMWSNFDRRHRNQWVLGVNNMDSKFMFNVRPLMTSCWTIGLCLNGQWKEFLPCINIFFSFGYSVKVAAIQKISVMNFPPSDFQLIQPQTYS